MTGQRPVTVIVDGQFNSGNGHKTAYVYTISQIWSVQHQLNNDLSYTLKSEHSIYNDQTAFMPVCVLFLRYHFVKSNVLDRSRNRWKNNVPASKVCTRLKACSFDAHCSSRCLG